MRIIETALWPPEWPDGLGEGVRIGVVGETHVAGLVEGERVLLREVNELQVEAIVHQLTFENGFTVWFGEFQGEPEVIPTEHEFPTPAGEADMPTRSY